MLLFASLLIPAMARSAPQDVTGSGTGGTIPVWTGTGTSTGLGAVGATDATASQNLFITGPSPWYDVKATGTVMGDTQTIKCNALAAGSTTLTCPGVTFNAMPDQGKYVISPDPIFAMLPPPVITLTTGTTGGIDASVTPYVYIKILAASGTSFGAPTLETVVPLPAGPHNIITVTAPTNPGGAGYWSVYAAGSGGSVAISMITQTASATVSVTTALANPFAVGENVIIAGTSGTANYNGSYKVTGVTSSTIFTFQMATPSTGSASGGTAATLLSAASSFEALQSGGGAASGCSTHVSFGCAFGPSASWATGTSFKTGTSPVPAIADFVTTITTATGSDSVTLATGPANAIPAASAFVYGTDDSSAINLIIGHCPKNGCKVFFPPGSYLVMMSTINIAPTTPQNFVFLQGAGGSSSVGVGLISGNVAGTTEIVTANPIYPLTGGTGGGTVLNAGPRISNIAFRDVSGACAAGGGIEFQGVAHAYLDNLSFADFCGGNSLYFSGPSQYNFILNPTITNAKSAIVFANANTGVNGKGVNSSNWIIGGNLVHGQVGGGVCIDFQQQAMFPGTTSGGHNYIWYPQCDFFSVAVSLFDQNTDDVFIHAEQSATMPPGLIGSPGSGMGMALDGTSTATCSLHQITASSFSSFATSVQVTPSCANVVITSPSYVSTSPHLVDAGINTQTIGAPPDNLNMTFPGAANSLAEYFASATPVTPGDLECFVATLTSTVSDCSAANPINFIGIAVSGAGTPGQAAVQVAGTASVNLVGSQVISVGDTICSSPTAGLAKSLGTGSCALPGQQVGIAEQAVPNTALTILVLIQRH